MSYRSSSSSSIVVRGEGEFKCYKVVSVHFSQDESGRSLVNLGPQRYMSAVIDVPDLLTEYKIGEFVPHPVTGFGLLVFARLRDAEYFNRSIYPMGAIFEATGRGPMDTDVYEKRYTSVSTKIQDKPRILSDVVDPFGWPLGSLMFEEVRLDVEYEYNLED